MKMPLFRYFLLAATISIGLAMSNGARADDWTRASNYPARVEAIQFNNTIDENNSVTWGAWSVGFGPELPTASRDLKSCGQTFLIQGLVCRNAVAGEKECSISLSDCGGGGWHCILGGGGTGLLIEIKCPKDITFKH